MTSYYQLPRSPKKGTKRPFVLADEEVIARTYRDDDSWTHESLAEAVGVSSGTIRAVLKRQGVSSRKSGTSGPRHQSWNGGLIVDSYGYRRQWIPDEHPFASMKGAKGRVAVHRLRMAESLGRPLRKDESVHHIDGDKLNNHLSNLQLRTGSHGAGISLQCVDCGSTNIEPIALGE